MDHQQFLSIIQQTCHVDAGAAESATAATLQTLAERLPTREARQLVEQLPPELGPLLFRSGPVVKYDVDEFVARVSQRLGADLPTAERQMRCVLTALARALPDADYTTMVGELPKDFARLLPGGPWVEVPAGEDILHRVAERIGGDARSARVVVDATLETLAERIAGGEVDDLLKRLPRDLHPPLERGRDVAPTATRMSLDRFVERVAERAGIDDPLVAREQVHAVLRTLREAVGDDEFFDVTVQLPPEYDVLWVR